MAYRKQQQMHRARQLLTEDDRPVDHVARAVGYRDPKAFSKHFKKAVGMTPSQFRLGRGRS